MPAHYGRPAALSRSCDRTEIVADAIVHVIGVSLGLVGAVVLLFAAHLAGGSAVLPVGVYVAGLLAVLGLSAAYNLWPVSPINGCSAASITPRSMC